MDDEPGVRAFMAEALRGAGYDAIEAADVGVALRLWKPIAPICCSPIIPCRA
ncbi:MAG: hypothetical protein NVV62_11340 [Terricaulis sp.]|nr:hypothetical protein [Terricaulis sp.]